MMDREEAITELSVLHERFRSGMGWRDGNYEDALDMAIEALSQPNYETDTEVRLAVTNRKKEKVILWDAFGEVEYYPIESLSAETPTDQQKHQLSEETPTNVPTDLISRADAEAFVCMERCGEYRKDCPAQTCPIIEHLDSIPSADRPSGEWIPCSERLPEDGQPVIITTDDEAFKDHPVGSCIYQNGRFQTNYKYDIKMIAWMPLPKPYCPNCGAKMGGSK